MVPGSVCLIMIYGRPMETFTPMKTIVKQVLGFFPIRRRRLLAVRLGCKLNYGIPTDVPIMHRITIIDAGPVRNATINIDLSSQIFPVVPRHASDTLTILVRAVDPSSLPMDSLHRRMA